MRTRLVAVALLALLGTGCVDGEGAQQAQPVSGQDGLRATGVLDGARIAISRGSPTVVLGDCDPNDGLDRDLCLLVRTIDGLQLNLVVENPDALVAGEQLPIGERECGDTGCDGITDVAVVFVRVDGRQLPVEGGRLEVEQAGPRYAAAFDLRLPNGERLTGDFDVSPPGVPPTIGPDGNPTEAEDAG